MFRLACVPVRVVGQCIVFVAAIVAMGCSPAKDPDDGGQTPVCGNEVLETGEDCEPPDGKGCSAHCQWVTPAPWSCGEAAWWDGVCDCGCRVMDKDCPDATFAVCERCTSLGSCSRENGCEVGLIRAEDNAFCVEPSCGNNLVEAGEVCDPPDGTSCSSDCRVIIPPAWTCGGSTYGARDGCDCGCGVVDPDCDGATTLAACDTCDGVGSCSQGFVCSVGLIAPSDNAACIETACGNSVVEPGESCDPPDGITCTEQCQDFVPLGWSCDESSYFDGACDCGCSVRDADCADATSAVCERCTNPGSCSRDNSCTVGLIRADDNAFCVFPTCGNGVLEAGEVCDPPDGETCSPDCTVAVPPEWTCAVSTYGAGDGCDCGCAVADPDCAGAITVEACDNCGGAGSCSEGFACSFGLIVPDHNVACGEPACGNSVVEPGEHCDPPDGVTCGDQCERLVPVGWTCNGSFYFDGDCDCGCGVLDADCPDATSACGYDNCVFPQSADPTENFTCLSPSCGDGEIQRGEDCDDGNSTGGDGCSADCGAVEEGYLCEVAGESCRAIVCGDGIIDDTVYGADGMPVEQCEPSVHGTEACDGSCHFILPSGWTCDPYTFGDGFCTCGCCAMDIDCADALSSSCEVCSASGSCNGNQACPGIIEENDNTACGPAVCGNGVAEGPESCEPPDTETCDDACNAVAWSCDPGFYDDGVCDCGCGAPDPDCGGALSSTVCGATHCSAPSFVDPDRNHFCVAPGCGNGVVEPSRGELCDPPGGVACDCDRDCQPVIPEGWTCAAGVFGAGDGCHCGCGLVDPDCPNSSVGACEVCNLAGSCNGQPPCPGIINATDNAVCDAAVCGNGVVEGTEECDLPGHPACEPVTCTRVVPIGWTCPEVTVADGICDCGCGAFDADCASLLVGDCKVDHCLSPLVPAPDDNATCVAIVCGNGAVEINGSPQDEECDDGNDDTGDGCSATCQVEDGYVCPTPGAPCDKLCGNGVWDAGETCDDGNEIAGDGCSDICQEEPGYKCSVPGQPCVPE